MERARDLEGARAVARDVIAELVRVHPALLAARSAKDVRRIGGEELARARKRFRLRVSDAMRKHLLLEEAIEEVIVRANLARFEAELEAEEREAIRDATGYREAPPARPRPRPVDKKHAPPTPAAAPEPPAQIEQFDGQQLEARMEFARRAVASAVLVLMLIALVSARGCRRERAGRVDLADEVHARFREGSCSIVETHRELVPNAPDRLVVTYAFEHEGRRHIGTAFSPTSAAPPTLESYAPRSEVRCYYDPDAPGRLFLDRGDRNADRGDTTVEWFVALVIAAAAWFGFAPKHWFAED